VVVSPLGLTVSLTFRNVALSLVTMDGLTRMLSCMMKVKLQRNTQQVSRLTPSRDPLSTRSCSPVNDLPGVGQVSHDLHGDEDFLLDVDGADHLVQKPPGVSQELADLEVGLQLVELLDLRSTGTPHTPEPKGWRPRPQAEGSMTCSGGGPGAHEEDRGLMRRTGGSGGGPGAQEEDRGPMRRTGGSGGGPGAHDEDRGPMRRTGGP